MTERWVVRKTPWGAWMVFNFTERMYDYFSSWVEAVRVAAGDDPEYQGLIPALERLEADQ